MNYMEISWASGCLWNDPIIEINRDNPCFNNLFEAKKALNIENIAMLLAKKIYQCFKGIDNEI